MNNSQVTNKEVVTVLRDRGYTDKQIEDCNFELWEQITESLQQVGEMIKIVERLDDLGIKTVILTEH